MPLSENLPVMPLSEDLFLWAVQQEYIWLYSQHCPAISLYSFICLIPRKRSLSDLNTISDLSHLGQRIPKIHIIFWVEKIILISVLCGLILNFEPVTPSSRILQQPLSPISTLPRPLRVLYIDCNWDLNPNHCSNTWVPLNSLTVNEISTWYITFNSIRFNLVQQVPMKPVGSLLKIPPKNRSTCSISSILDEQSSKISNRLVISLL